MNWGKLADFFKVLFVAGVLFAVFAGFTDEYDIAIFIASLFLVLYYGGEDFFDNARFNGSDSFGKKVGKTLGFMLIVGIGSSVLSIVITAVAGL